MEENVRMLIWEIKELERELEVKRDKLKLIQGRCSHRWPEGWHKRPIEDYSLMSPAVDHAVRRKKPELKIVYVQECELCGKERREE